MKTRILKVEIFYEHDVVLSRQRARQIAGALKFNPQDQVRIATAVSEIARNTFRYAGGGALEFFVEPEPKPVLQMVLTDRGPGISNLSTILDGKYISRTGMGLGILGAKKLMDGFQIETNSKGTTVVLKQFIANVGNKFDRAFFAGLAEELSQQTSQEPFVELQQQNQELLAAFSELEKRQADLARLNAELEEYKRQLDLQNEQLESRVSERTAELKNSLQEMERFCYSIAHDLKAPLRAMAGLTTILKEDYAPAFDEAGRNCTNRIIQAAARMDLLIRDLLHYGQLTHMDVPLTSINLSGEITEALERLRGEILATEATIEVKKEMPNVLANPVLLQQVFLNLIENALKFVESGMTPCLKIWTEDRMQNSNDASSKPIIRLWIQDNGIGISTSNNQRIFKLFERLHPENSAYPGTGIGLALVQKAMDRMNGAVGVESPPGGGSLFWIELPSDISAANFP